MATNGGVNIKVALQNVDKFVRAVRLTNDNVRTGTQRVIKEGTERVTAKTSARVPVRSGELKYSIRAEFTKDGMTGFVKAGYGKLVRRSHAMTERGKKRAAKLQERREKHALQFRLANNSRQAVSVRDLGIYAPVVEWGDKRRHKPARHYMVPSLNEEKPSIAADLAKVPKDAASQGGLTT